jgi:hypothetical protein
MTNEDKKLIADYMEWIWLVEHYITKDNSRFLDRKIHFNLNDAGLCVQEMQKRGDWEYFVGDTEDTLIYNIRYHKEHHSYKSFLVAWLFNAENFFAAMSEWLKEVK